MNKSELIEAMANTASLSKKDAEAALNAYTDVITEALKKGDKVTLVGFGTYETRKEPPVPARIPKPAKPLKSRPQSARFQARQSLEGRCQRRQVKTDCMHCRRAAPILGGPPVFSAARAVHCRLNIAPAGLYAGRGRILHLSNQLLTTTIRIFSPMLS